MKIIRNKGVGITWILVLLVSFGIFNSTNIVIASQDETNPVVNPEINDLIEATEIYIYTDANVASYATGGGDGSPGNPYILENYNITGGGPYGILVDSGPGNSFNVSFTIRNCVVTALEVCIKIVDAYPNLVRIESCICTGTVAGDGIGIHLVRCDGAVLWNNTCNNNLHTGIRLDTTALALIEQNVCNENGDEGLYLDNASDNCVIQDNDIILNGGFGIFNEISHNNNFLLNTVVNNSWEGIVISNSQSAVIENNSVETNGFAYAGHGIFYINSDNGQIIFNHIVGHNGYGLSIDLISDSIIVHHNNFIQNNVGGLQAKEDATLTKINATWYDIGLLEGNYYDDYVGPGPYSIFGTANNNDPYPLNNPVNIVGIPEFPSILVGLIFIVSILGSAIIFYKKK
ncbi:MAG: NosD domain-containing protein [Candidatus Heimdallarchaeaceae archaeon]